jgi:iron-sulfur cluster assembly accessory protein
MQMLGEAFMTATITLSDSAITRIAAILAAEPDGTKLRISVEGGGCSGFQYKYDLVQEAAGADDLVLGDGKAIVLIDAVSQPFLQGSVIDYKMDAMGASFHISNPNATASCGCGTSFAL